MEQSALDKFGQFFVENLFDKGMDCYVNLLANHYKSPETLALQKDLQGFSPEQLDIIKAVVLKTLTTASHDFLFALEERNDLEEDIQLLVDGKNIADESDGLNGELFSEDGWLQKYSHLRKK